MGFTWSPFRQFVRFEELFFGIVGLDEPVYPYDFEHAAHLVLLGDDKHGAFVLLHVAQAVNEQADPSAVKECRPLEVEYKMMVALPNQPRYLVIEDFRAFGAVNIPDDMDHLELAAVFNFVLHEKPPGISCRYCCYKEIVTKYTPLEHTVKCL